jgi:hypothetical protein
MLKERKEEVEIDKPAKLFSRSKRLKTGIKSQEERVNDGEYLLWMIVVQMM